MSDPSQVPPATVSPLPAVGLAGAASPPLDAAAPKPAGETEVAATNPAENRKGLIDRDLNDIYLLLDHLSGRPDRQVSALQIDVPNENYGKSDARDGKEPFVRRNLIQSVCEIGWPPGGGNSRYSAHAATTLFTARDILNDIAAPASGMTVAFTIMMTDPPKKRDAWWRLSILSRNKTRTPKEAGQDTTKAHPAGTASDTAKQGYGKDEQSPEDNRKDRARLALAAFPHLLGPATKLRREMGLYTLALLVAVFITAGLSWNVTSGKLILERLNSLKLRAQTEAARIVSADEGRSQGITASIGTSDDVPDAGSTLDTICDPKTGLSKGGTAEPASPSNPGIVGNVLCQAGHAIMGQRYAADRALEQWFLGWSRIPFFKFLVIDREDPREPSSPASRSPAPDAADYNRLMIRRAAYLEQEAGDLNSVLVSYVLPMLYGFIGATAAVIRGLNVKMRESTLAPRDINASRVQLVLGVIVGACIGLFVSPTGAPDAHLPNVTLAGNAVALSASAFAFLAGFGVEAVFKWIETLITIAFAAGSAVGSSAGTPSKQARTPTIVSP